MYRSETPDLVCYDIVVYVRPEILHICMNICAPRYDLSVTFLFIYLLLFIF